MKKRHILTPDKKQARQQKRKEKSAERKTSSDLSKVWQFLWVLIVTPRFFYFIIAQKPWYMDDLVWLMLLFALYNQFRIYYPFFRRIIRMPLPDRIITNGWFRFTRHPMYTLVFVADLINLFYVPFSWRFVVHTIAFYLITIAACYWHERELLANFGEEAKNYYSKTPRLIFAFPLRRWIIL